MGIELKWQMLLEKYGLKVNARKTKVTKCVIIVANIENVEMRRDIRNSVVFVIFDK